jgi:cell division protease FtsH
MVEKRTQINIWYFILALLAVVWIRDIWVENREVEQISYNEFQKALDDGRIQEVEVLPDTIRGTYKDASGQGAKQFSTPRVDLDLAAMLEQHNVVFKGVVETTFFS